MEKKINTKAKKEIILIFFSIFFVSLVYALTPPPLPDHFIGNVSMNGQDASIGTQISVYVKNELEGTVLTTIAGEYDLYVKTGEVNDLIKFKISDILAGNSTRQGGKTINLDLLATTTTTTPPSGGSSGSGGGSGGGGGSSGGSGGIISPPSTAINESTSGPRENTTQTPETGEQEEISPGITGAVIGFLESGKGITTLVVMVILVIGVILIKFRPQKWTKRFSH